MILQKITIPSGKKKAYYEQIKKLAGSIRHHNLENKDRGKADAFVMACAEHIKTS